MEKLISIIGLAPSEIPFQELLEKLSRERSRIADFIRERRPKEKVAKAPKKPSQKKTISPSLLADIAKLTGLSQERLKKGEP